MVLNFILRFFWLISILPFGNNPFLSDGSNDELYVTSFVSCSLAVCSLLMSFVAAGAIPGDWSTLLLDAV